MEPVRANLAEEARGRALVRAVAPEHVVSEAALVHSLDLATMAPSDQDFTAPFRLTVGAGACSGGRRLVWGAGGLALRRAGRAGQADQPNMCHH